MSCVSAQIPPLIILKTPMFLTQASLGPSQSALLHLYRQLHLSSSIMCTIFYGTPGEA